MKTRPYTPGGKDRGDRIPGKKKMGRPKGSKDKVFRRQTSDRMVSLRLDNMPWIQAQPKQTEYTTLILMDLLARWWFQEAAEQEMLRTEKSPLYREERLNYAVKQAQIALANVAPYRHPRVSKMPQQLDLTRLDGEELKVFRSLFIKAMSTGTTIDQKVVEQSPGETENDDQQQQSGNQDD